MKQIIMFENVIKIYYVHSRSMGEYRDSILVQTYEEYSIDNYEKHVNWEIFAESDLITRELNTGEYVQVDGEGLKIVKVLHSQNGDIIYHTNKKIIIENEDSRLSVENEIKYIQEQEQKNIQDQQRILQEEVDNAKKKKWYDFR